MKIVFMGSPGFAIPSLKILLENGYEIAAVVTAPDKKAGRGQKIQMSAVKEFALENNLKVLQPTNLKSDDFLIELQNLKAALNIIVAFRMLPEKVWSMFPLGSMNLHASLLPNYRGAAPINWAIINGEKFSGATTFMLKHEIDTGNVIDQVKVKISDQMTAGELHDILMIKGAELVLDSVVKIEHGQLELKEQDLEDWHKKAPKIYKEDTYIDWGLNAEIIGNKIRGLNPFPSARTLLNNKLIKIHRAIPANLTTTEIPGSIIITEDLKLSVSCGGTSTLIIEELQLEGKRKMTSKDFLAGNNVKGFRFSNKG